MMFDLCSHVSSLWCCSNSGSSWNMKRSTPNFKHSILADTNCPWLEPNGNIPLVFCLRDRATTCLAVPLSAVVTASSKKGSWVILLHCCPLPLSQRAGSCLVPRSSLPPLLHCNRDIHRQHYRQDFQLYHPPHHHSKVPANL